MKKSQYIQTMQNTGEELQHYVDQDGEKLSTFGPISRVNILVGATISGKSRFMRGLAKSPNYVIVSLDPSIAHPNSVLTICERLLHEKFDILIRINPEGVDDVEALTGKFPWLRPHLKPKKGSSELRLTSRRWDRNILSPLREDSKGSDSDQNRKNNRRNLSTFVQQYRLALQTPDHDTADREWFILQEKELTEDAAKNIETVLEFIEALLSSNLPQQLPSPKTIYIPVLRTTLLLKKISTSDTTDNLAQSISMSYKLENKVEVFTGNSLYWTIRKELSSDPKTYKRLKDFERFLSKAFFKGVSINLVPLDEEHAPGRHLALNIDEQVQRWFQDVGDGIQAIIILMYRLFTAQPGTWIFIEEPEQGLHPGLQRIFLETLAQHPDLRDKNLKIFMSTHSNHLLGVAVSELEDVSVFAFQQRWTDTGDEQFQIRPIHTRQQNLLTLLGVANSSVFLANCGIWVEGVTDRKYLQAYLSAYLESDELEAEDNFVPQEDIHYAFFEYAGSNLVHYLFDSEDDASSDQAEQIRAQFLCNRIFLLADRDEDKGEKHERLEGCQSDSFQYFVTPGIEVENLISETQLSQVLPQLIRGLTEKDVAGANIQYSVYHEKHIGLYLKETFGDLCPDSLKAKSGTLKPHYKNKLAKLVCPHITWENMSEDARDLTKVLYKFIYKHNQVQVAFEPH